MPSVSLCAFSGFPLCKFFKNKYNLFPFHFALMPLCRCATLTANLSTSMPLADYLLTEITKIEKY
jgi:hypothetical protein